MEVCNSLTRYYQEASKPYRDFKGNNYTRNNKCQSAELLMIIESIVHCISLLLQPARVNQVENRYMELKVLKYIHCVHTGWGKSRFTKHRVHSCIII